MQVDSTQHGEITFRPVADHADLARLETALRRLSGDIGEDFMAESCVLARAVLADQPSAYGLLALQGAQTLSAVLYGPVFSTVRGAAGVYVSDLWVSEGARGQGLGAQVLAMVARDGAARWQATWLKLGVYDHSQSAQQFYQRLGFTPTTGLREMRLGPAGVTALIKRTV